MTWIKASERLPEGVVKCRWVSVDGNQIGHIFLSNIYPDGELLIFLEWLDESDGENKQTQ